MKVRLSNVRGTFLHLNAPQVPSAEILQDNPNAKPKYTGTFILDSSSKVLVLPVDPKAKPVTMDDILKSVAVDAWKEKGPAFLATLERNRKCFRPGDTQLDKSGSVYDGFAGNTFVVAKNGKPPKFFSQVKDPITDPAEIGRIFYWGAYYDAVVEVYPSTKGSKGLFAELQIVQFRRDGEPLGGGSNATADDLEAIEVDSAADLM